LDLRGLRVLVVDDDPEGLEEAVQALQRQGIQVERATSAGQALLTTVAIVPDLILVDIDLGGSDGLALVKRLRCLPPTQGGRLPAITVNDKPLTGRRLERWRKSRCQGHLTKPVDPVELMALVQVLAGHDVDRRRPAQGERPRVARKPVYFRERRKILELPRPR